jgi:hypothetical protein
LVPTAAFFSQGCLQRSHSKVLSFLQWAKIARCHGGKIPLFVNMDETSMKLNYGRQRGLLVRKRALPPGKKHRKEKMSASDAKANVSFLAFLTHDTAIQPKLPQVILGNKHKMTLKIMKELALHQPENFRVWREESSWNNHCIMRKLISLLATCLKDYKATHQIILVLDVASCHRHTSIYALANRLGVRLLFVPAKLTYLLQPADTHLFSKLKASLRRRWRELLVESEAGTVSYQVWLSAFFGVARQILNSTRWQSAFHAAGLLDEQRLSSRVMQEAGWEVLPPIPEEILSDSQARDIFPKRSVVRKASLFFWCLPKVAAKAKMTIVCALSEPSAAASSTSLEGPISSRTRLRTKTSAPS